MTEPDVAITDYLLAIESLVLAALLIGQPDSRPDLRIWFVVFFVATGLAAALGGTVHGFFVDRPSRLGTVLWRGALISIGVVAASTWMIGVGVLWRNAPAGWVLTLVATQLIVYTVVVIAFNDAFRVAIVNCLPSTVFLVIAYWVAYQSRPSDAMAIGLAGVALTVIAAVGQRLRIGIHPIHFNHNALYHTFHGIALLMIFWSGRNLIGVIS